MARSDLKNINTTVYTYEFTGYNTLNHEMELGYATVNLFADKVQEKFRGKIEIIPTSYPLEDKWCISSKKMYDRELRAITDIESIYAEIEKILDGRELRLNNLKSSELFEVAALD